MESEINNSQYELAGTFTKVPEIDIEEINKLDIDEELKKMIIQKIGEYVKSMMKNQTVR